MFLLLADRAENLNAGKLPQKLAQSTGLADFLETIIESLPAVRTGGGGVGVAARLRSLAEDSTASWQFEADPSVVGQAREMVAQSLAAWDLDDLAFSTELIASELVTNAIRYAGGPIGLRLIKDRSLICEVADPSQTQPHLRHAKLMDEGGRGLFLVHQLTDQWGSRYTSAGKTIWTSQDITNATAAS
ncbi:ATP-binding protein [Streptomyces sp. NBC_00090]|uniref:ATP-binding protein n=1 Tax=Streptomyces sp. NBC_00090 TaxID=2903619 RepID=UPI003868074A